MELNTEINKVFGQEMAKIFVSTIDEEEMKAKAEEIWKQINLNKYEYGTRKNSEIEDLIKNTILAKIQEKITVVLKEPINDEILEKKARDMVEEARKVAEEMIVKQLAHNISEKTMTTYSRISDDIVQNIMMNVHAEMENRNRGW